MKPIHITALAGGVLVIIAVLGCVAIAQQPGQNASNKTNVSPVVCPTLYAPVCGIDNKTYANDCIARAAGVAIAYSGTCAVAEMQKCTDSDSGKNVLEAGIASSAGASAADSCINETDVLEYYCGEDAISNEAISCPSGHACFGGKCSLLTITAPSCTDSDNGADAYVAGNVTYKGAVYSDECTMVNQVKEYYCFNNSVANAVTVCDLGFQCVNGACTEMPSVCNDTDAGRVVAKKGSLTLYKGYSLIDQQTDSCFDDKTVREWYCAGNAVANENINCGLDFECYDGACISLSCTDSDRGQDIFVVGTATKGTDSYADTCVSNYNLKEYYCLDNAIQYSMNTCPTEYICKNGACVLENACMDTDSGKDYYNAGIVTKGTGIYSDTCKGTLLVEYYCSDNTVLSETVSCGSSASCINGYCKAK